MKTTVLLMCQSGIVRQLLDPVEQGIHDVLRAAGAEHRVEVKYNGNSSYDAGNSLDIHLEHAKRNSSRVYIDTWRLRESLTTNLRSFPHHVEHYKVVVVRDKLADPYSRGSIAHGCATRDKLAIISIAGLTGFTPEVLAEIVRTLSAHEFGHTLGLVPKERLTNVVSEVMCGFTIKHCSNRCVMRSDTTLVQDTATRLLEGRSFCSECTAYLRGLR